MNVLLLVRRNLWRHPIRTVLSFGFALLALFLFVFLRSVVSTLENSTKISAANRIAVQSAVSLFVYLPESYWRKIEKIPGVESAGPWVWFGGYYQDEKNFFAQFAVDVKTHVAQYPELQIEQGSVADLLADRQGCLVGFETASKFGWKIGDRVPIITNIYAIERGQAWSFNLRAIYRSTKANLDDKTLFFHYDYLKEMRRTLKDAGYGAAEQDVSVYMTKVAPGHEAEEVISAIDAQFENGPQKTRTQSGQNCDPEFLSISASAASWLIAFR